MTEISMKCKIIYTLSYSMRRSSDSGSEQAPDTGAVTQQPYNNEGNLNGSDYFKVGLV